MHILQGFLDSHCTKSCTFSLDMICKFHLIPTPTHFLRGNFDGFHATQLITMCMPLGKVHNLSVLWLPMLQIGKNTDLAGLLRTLNQAICTNLLLFSPREWITSTRVRNLYGWLRQAVIKNTEDIFSFVSYFPVALKTIF